jgi:hypothetical protein
VVDAAIEGAAVDQHLWDQWTTVTAMAKARMGMSATPETAVADITFHAFPSLT